LLTFRNFVDDIPYYLLIDALRGCGPELLEEYRFNEENFTFELGLILN